MARRWAALRLGALLVACGLTVVPAASSSLQHGRQIFVAGPLGRLLSASTDLGPSTGSHVRLTAALAGPARPLALIRWATAAGLSVDWRPGENWAVIDGAAAAMAGALGVDVRDYRGRRGQQFYAATRQPALPSSLATELTGFGRILGYTPTRQSRPTIVPQDVPTGGLAPDELRRIYNIAPLADKGFTGKDRTVVIFGFDGFDQPDLDTFADVHRLPRFTPVTVGEMPSQRTGETTMDLEMAHAMAPDARTVFVNARPTATGDGAYQKIAAMMDSADRQFPGAVWSFSIGWGCDKLLTPADLAPVRAALARAQQHGTTAFDASGDLAGLECKGGQDWSAAPSSDDIGLDSVASLPEMTSVGGTTLSTTDHGERLQEQAWFDVPLTHGSAGGVSALFERPSWQRSVLPEQPQRRLVPDVSAVADFFTGARMVFGGELVLAGGTSMAAPLWAGMTAAIDQYLLAQRGRLLGNINPLLYRVLRAGNLPALHDITVGGNAIAMAGPGYDLVTGLGTPDVDSLARSLLLAQGASR